MRIDIINLVKLTMESMKKKTSYIDLVTEINNYEVKEERDIYDLPGIFEPKNGQSHKFIGYTGDDIMVTINIKEINNNIYRIGLIIIKETKLWGLISPIKDYYDNVVNLLIINYGSCQDMGYTKNSLIFKKDEFEINIFFNREHKMDMVVVLFENKMYYNHF